MSYSSQMAGLTVQNFVSAATGIALAVALVRGFARASAKGIGNFWVDLVRCHALRAAAALHRAGAVLVWQGVPQNLDAYVEATTLEGGQADDRPGAGRLAGRDQDAGHQRRRLLQRQLRASLREPDGARPTSSRCCRSSRSAPALTNVFGRMVGDERQGWAILAAMGVLFLAGVAVAYWAEAGGNPLARRRSASTRPAATWRARRSASASPPRRCSP